MYTVIAHLINIKTMNQRLIGLLNITSFSLTVTKSCYHVLSYWFLGAKKPWELGRWWWLLCFSWLSSVAMYLHFFFILKSIRFFEILEEHKDSFVNSFLVVTFSYKAYFNAQGPVHRYPFLFENRHFFPRFQKIRLHTLFLNLFFPVHTKKQ